MSWTSWLKRVKRKSLRDEADVPHLRAMVPLTDKEILQEFDTARDNDVVASVASNYGLASHPICTPKGVGWLMLVSGLFAASILLIVTTILFPGDTFLTLLDEHSMLVFVPLLFSGQGLLLLLADYGSRRPEHPIIMESALRSLIMRSQDSVQELVEQNEDRQKWLSNIHRLDSLARKHRLSLELAKSNSERARLTKQIQDIEADRAAWMRLVTEFDEEKSELYAINRQIVEMAEPVLFALATRDASEVMAKAGTVTNEVTVSSLERESDIIIHADLAVSIREQLLSLQQRAADRRGRHSR